MALRRRIKQMVGVRKPVQSAMPLGFQTRDEPWPLASDVPRWQESAALLRQRNIEQERLVSLWPESSAPAQMIIFPEALKRSCTIRLSLSRELPIVAAGDPTMV